MKAELTIDDLPYMKKVLEERIEEIKKQLGFDKEYFVVSLENYQKKKNKDVNITEDEWIGITRFVECYADFKKLNDDNHSISIQWVAESYDEDNEDKYYDESVLFIIRHELKSEMIKHLKDTKDYQQYHILKNQILNVRKNYEKYGIYILPFIDNKLAKEMGTIYELHTQVKYAIKDYEKLVNNIKDILGEGNIESDLIMKAKKLRIDGIMSTVNLSMEELRAMLGGRLIK